MLDKGQKELGDLLKEGAVALIQMRKGIENACTQLRAVYSKMAPQYLREPEQGSVVKSRRVENNMNAGNKLFPLLPIDKPHRLS
jgi:hypothetical protein